MLYHVLHESTNKKYTKISLVILQLTYIPGICVLQEKWYSIFFKQILPMIQMFFPIYLENKNTKNIFPGTRSNSRWKSWSKKWRHHVIFDHFRLKIGKT